MVHDVKQSKSVADARVVEGPALSVDVQGELKSVAETRAVEGPALSVDEPSEQSKSVADARAVEGLSFSALPVSASQRTRRPAPWCMM